MKTREIFQGAANVSQTNRSIAFRGIEWDMKRGLTKIISSCRQLISLDAVTKTLTRGVCLRNFKIYKKLGG